MLVVPYRYLFSMNFLDIIYHDITKLQEQVTTLNDLALEQTLARQNERNAFRQAEANQPHTVAQRNSHFNDMKLWDQDILNTTNQLKRIETKIVTLQREVPRNDLLIQIKKDDETFWDFHLLGIEQVLTTSLVPAQYGFARYLRELVRDNTSLREIIDNYYNENQSSGNWAGCKAAFLGNSTVMNPAMMNQRRQNILKTKWKSGSTWLQFISKLEDEVFKLDENTRIGLLFPLLDLIKSVADDSCELLINNMNMTSVTAFFSAAKSFQTMKRRETKDQVKGMTTKTNNSSHGSGSTIPEEVLNRVKKPGDSFNFKGKMWYWCPNHGYPTSAGY